MTNAEAVKLTDVLVFSKTTGYRHASIPAGIEAIRRLGADNGFAVTATEDADHFTATNLAGYQVVVFLSTSGELFGAAQRSAFESYIGGGGGFVGIHAATASEYDWPFYGGLVGAYFADHPEIQQATVRVEDVSTVSTAHLDPTWVRTDEWYNYRTNPRAEVRVLLTVDEGTYKGGTMGDHPITWWHEYGGGRAWYTGLGHADESYVEPAFVRMVLGGITMAAGT